MHISNNLFPVFGVYYGFIVVSVILKLKVKTLASGGREYMAIISKYSLKGNLFLKMKFYALLKEIIFNIWCMLCLCSGFSYFDIRHLKSLMFDMLLK